MDIDSIYEEIKNIFSGEKLTTQRIILLLPKILEIIERFGAIKKLSGQEKKDLLLQIISKLIEKDNRLSNSERQDLSKFVTIELSLLIDGMVYAYNSEAFAEIKKRAGSWLRKILSCK